MTYDQNYQIGGLSGGTIGIAGVAPPRQAPSFTSEIEMAVSMASDVRQRLERLAERLCGDMPADTATPANTLRGVPNGVFDQVTDIGRRIISDMERMSVAFDRIERSLP